MRTLIAVGLCMLADVVCAQEKNFQLVRDIYLGRKNLLTNVAPQADDYVKSYFRIDETSMRYHNGRDTKSGRYMRYVGGGVRTKEYSKAHHYWSLVSVRHDTHSKNFKKRWVTSNTGYLVLDSIAGIERDAWKNKISLNMGTKFDKQLVYAKGVTADICLLNAPEVLWGHLLSPLCADITITKGTIDNVASVCFENLRETTGVLWDMCNPVMDEGWMGHMERAFAVLGRLVAERMPHDTLSDSFNALLIMSELADGTLKAESVEEVFSESASIAALNDVFRSLPKRLLPILYLVNGQEFPGYVVEL